MTLNSVPLKLPVTGRLRGVRLRYCRPNDPLSAVRTSATEESRASISTASIVPLTTASARADVETLETRTASAVRVPAREPNLGRTRGARSTIRFPVRVAVTSVGGCRTATLQECHLANNRPEAGELDQAGRNSENLWNSPEIARAALASSQGCPRCAHKSSQQYPQRIRLALLEHRMCSDVTLT